MGNPLDTDDPSPPTPTPVRTHPWWQVTGVFDPDGGGADFAYTVGLASEGVPELHMWARPTLGDDPGLDWMFSLRDRTGLLNELAWRLLEGDLAPGATWSESYDEGLVRAHFTVGDPVPAEEVEAFGAGDAAVLPVRWRLEREPEGPPAPMSDAAAAEAQALLAGLTGLLGTPGRSAPPGWRRPPDPAAATWSPRAGVGPREPLVLLRASQVWDADLDRWLSVMDHAMAVAGRGAHGYAVSVARTAARPAGRAAAVAEVELRAQQLMAGFGDSWGVAEHAALREWFTDGLGPDADDAWAGARHLLGEVVGALLVIEVVADLLPERVVAWGQGPVACAPGPMGVAVEHRYVCDEATAEVLRDLLAARDRGPLVRAAVAWHEAAPGSTVHHELMALQLTGAAHAPFIGDLVPERRQQGWARSLHPHGLTLFEVQPFVNAVATLMSRPDDVSPQARDAVLRVGRGVRGLERALRRT